MRSFLLFAAAIVAVFHCYEIVRPDPKKCDYVYVFDDVPEPEWPEAPVKTTEKAGLQRWVGYHYVIAVIGGLALLMSLAMFGDGLSQKRKGQKKRNEIKNMDAKIEERKVDEQPEEEEILPMPNWEKKEN